jgi:hypothetical protein
MVPPFDILKTETAGSLVWLETAATLDIARSRVEALGLTSPGEYVIFSQQTGCRTVIKIGGASSSSKSNV